MNRFTELASALRLLSVDAVHQAQSGHPGMPLGMADIATVLWKKFLKYNPKNPHWFDRDRFVLSNGHGSMLLYALLHLSGYALSMDEIKQFRQLHSKTPGHPEYGHTPGVETTTGPLGQGLANAVGMALAEKILAAKYNREELTVINHHTYVFVGDGCLMEGISHEACSLAGTLGLGKLIVFYDDNGISIDGQVESWFTDDSASRFRAYHWQVLGPIDGHDMQAIEEATRAALANTTQPSLIICKTVIGLGASVAGSEKSHGSPLSAEDIQKVRHHFNWPHPPFVIPDFVYQQWNHEEEGRKAEDQWISLMCQYQTQNPELAQDLLRRMNGDLPDHWPQASADFATQCLKENKAMATRKASQYCIEHWVAKLPELFGGSADLTGSNNTDCSLSKMIKATDFSGNYLHYGVREFAMAAIMNGMAVHGGFIPFGGTFLVFADYARNAMRLSALMKQRVIYILSHDSIGLGEDGPTHQPIEHAAMLRMTPQMQVWRPADLVETALAWEAAIERHDGPSALLLSRQNLPPLPHTAEKLEEMKKGGYILVDCEGPPEAILLATGSEVHLAQKAADIMCEQGMKIRVVSMPCVERFLAQDEAYKEFVLPASVRRRVAIEAGSSAYWYQFVGLDGRVIGLDCFGVSAPGDEAYRYLGLTVDNIISALVEK